MMNQREIAGLFWFSNAIRAVLPIIVVLWACANAPAVAQPSPAVEVQQLEASAVAAEHRGDAAQAEALLQQALAMQEKTLGADTADLANYLERLSSLGESDGRYQDAEQYEQHAMTIRTALFGPDSTDVAKSLNILAAQQINQGHFAAAEPLALRSLNIRLKVLGPDHIDVAQSRNTLSEIYRNEGRLAEAEPLKRQVVATIERLAPGSQIHALTFNNLAMLLTNEGKYPEAEPIYQHVLELLERAVGPESLPFAQALNNLAQVYEEEGRLAEAETMLRQALAVREKTLPPNHPDIVQTRANLATVLRQEGKLAEAEQQSESALRSAEVIFGPQDYRVAVILNSLGDLYRVQRRFLLAEDTYRRAIGIQESMLGPDHPYLATSLNNLGEMYYEEHRYDDAEPVLVRAVDIWRKADGDDHPDVAQGLTNLAGVHAAQHHLDAALSESNRAIDILSRDLTPSANSQTIAAARDQHQYRSDFLVNVEINYLTGQAAPDRRDKLNAVAFVAAQRAQQSSTGLAVANMAARAATTSPALQALFREQQDTLGLWQRSGSALAAAVSCAPGRCDAQATQRLRAERSEESQRIDRLDTEIATQFPAYGELTNPPPVTVAAAQALLAPDEALLVYSVGLDESWLWAMRRDNAELYRIAIGTKALANEVQALRLQLDPERNRDGHPFDVGRAYALYQKILQPAASLLEGANHVVVVPDLALQSLPLGVLVTAPPIPIQQAADYRKVAWFARDHAVTVLPSVSSLRALRELPPAAAPRPFIGIGNPVLSDPHTCHQDVQVTSLYRGGTGDVDAVRQLCSLTETANELAVLARAEGGTPDDLYLAERATKPIVTALPLANYRVVAFATHGLVAGDLRNLAEPALVLTPPAMATADDDGLLTASDVARLKLNADWVILSACNTAAGDTPGAEGLSGLARAFFYAGARTLLVSHWPVRSDAAEELTVRTLGGCAENPEWAAPKRCVALKWRSWTRIPRTWRTP
jgi:CHAT domain-containing protein/tetratricopeptide (TPR) repeat protein